MWGEAYHQKLKIICHLKNPISGRVLLLSSLVLIFTYLNTKNVYTPQKKLNRKIYGHFRLWFPFIIFKGLTYPLATQLFSLMVPD